MTLVGCGLIGGSIALALRRRWPRVHILAVDEPGVVRRALERGVVDEALSNRDWLHDLPASRDAVLVLSLPVDGILQLLPSVATTLHDRPPNARPLVLDVGSVKAPILALAEHLRCPRFVGGHPMAGREQSGIEHAEATLFDERRFVLCPGTTTDAADRRAARIWVEGLGAEALELDADLHDRCVAMVSHAPHLVAMALMDAAQRLQGELPSHAREEDLPWRLAAGSWRDATRVAAADPGLWQGIVAANREPIADALDRVIVTLERLRDGLRAGEGDPPWDDDGDLQAEQLARIRRRIGRYLPR